MLTRPTLLLLTDLWGKSKPIGYSGFVERLSNHFEVTILDSQELAGITRVDSEKELHQQFVEGGIDRAVQRLLSQNDSPTVLLGLSIGGSIGWKVLLSGFSARKLYAVSATRLRYETETPSCPVQLYYGQNDPYRPSSEWVEAYAPNTEIIPGLGHDMYTRPEVMDRVCSQILVEFS